MNQKLCVIGDVHGKFAQYNELVRTANDADQDTIQVGDFGLGFSKSSVSLSAMKAARHGDSFLELWLKEHQSEDPASAAWNPLAGKLRNRFIRGNHDNPASCKTFPNWISDATCETSAAGTKMFFLGGGLSIDKEYRTEDYDWWADEELSWRDLDTSISVYETVKPDVVFTHDCPTDICFEQLFKGKLLEKRSRTGGALQSMFEIHQPSLWIFGHFHMHRKEVIQGCEFVCLEELQTMSITV